MESTILFEEEQKFARKAIQDFFKIIMNVLLIGSIVSFMSSESRNQMGTGLLIGSIISALVSFILAKARLITRICSDGIYVRYPPLPGGYSYFSWESIDRVYLRTYNPLTEYGGWGIRIGARGRAYNVSGTIGIQLELRDGTKLLIGTNEPEQVAALLQRMGKLNHLEQL